MNTVPQLWRDDHRDEAAQVDRPVEDGEEQLGLLFLLRLLELISAKCGDTRLDSSCPCSHHEQPEKQESSNKCKVDFHLLNLRKC